MPGLFIWVLLVQTDDLRLLWQTLSHLPAPRHSLFCLHSFPCLSNRASRACFSLLLLHGALLFLCRCSVCPGCLCFKMCRFLEEAHLHPDPPGPAHASSSSLLKHFSSHRQQRCGYSTVSAPDLESVPPRRSHGDRRITKHRTLRALHSVSSASFSPSALSQDDTQIV